jgi:hypothetical protein
LYKLRRCVKITSNDPPVVFSGGESLTRQIHEMAEKKTWIVTTSPDRPLDEILKDLADAGFVVGQSLAEIGCITGSASPKTAAKLRKVRGVIDVSPDTAVDVGPPDSPDTW